MVCHGLETDIQCNILICNAWMDGCVFQASVIIRACRRTYIHVCMHPCMRACPSRRARSSAWIMTESACKARYQLSGRHHRPIRPLLSPCAIHAERCQRRDHVARVVEEMAPKSVASLALAVWVCLDETGDDHAWAACRQEAPDSHCTIQ